MDTPAEQRMTGEVERLHREFEATCTALYARWSAIPENKMPRMYIWNTNWWWDRVEDRGRRWRSYIRLFYEDWWYQRGYAYWIENGMGHIDQLSFSLSDKQRLLGEMDTKING